MKKLLALLLLSPLVFAEYEYGRIINLSCDLDRRTLCDGKQNLDSCNTFDTSQGIGTGTWGVTLKKMLGLAGITWEDKDYMPVPEWKDRWEIIIEEVNAGEHDLKGNVFKWNIENRWYEEADQFVDIENRLNIASGEFSTKYTPPKEIPKWSIKDTYQCRSVKSLLD